VIASVYSVSPLQFVLQPGRVFGAPRGIYRRTVIERSQRKGDRPGAGFDLLGRGVVRSPGTIIGERCPPISKARRGDRGFVHELFQFGAGGGDPFP
jgi:hypothetical protein